MRETALPRFRIWYHCAPNLSPYRCSITSLEANKETGEGHIRGGKSAQSAITLVQTGEKTSLPSSGTTVLFREKGYPFLEQEEEFGKGYRTTLLL